MKKYFKFPAESDLGIGIQYIEFDDNNWPIRQVDCYGDRFFNSNEGYHKELGCMGLCDQQLTLAGMKLGEVIEAEEFQLAWDLSNKKLVASHSTVNIRSRMVDSISNTLNQQQLENTPSIHRELKIVNKKVENIYLDLEIPTDCRIRSNVSLQGLTTWKVGGLAQWYFEPFTLTEIQSGFAWAKKNQLPITIIGAGSNLLISDRGLNGLVICTRHLRCVDTQFDLETRSIIVDAGKMFATLSWKAASRGWGGLEWAAGIPGTVGGSVANNAGAHGHSTQEILVSTEVLNLDGSIETLENQDLDYSYRASNLQAGAPRILLSAKFKLEAAGDPEEIKARTFRDLEKRHSKQPYDRPCGYVFRNPSPQYAAALIESLGLKGYRIGGAEVSTLHANFIINHKDATATEIRELIYFVQSRVKAKYAIELQPEVKMLGEF
jgi:UDP-N-acetylmuramate dehydrogenase